MEIKGYMPVREYAEKVGKTRAAIYIAINEGRLEHIKIGNYTLVKT